MDYKYIHANTDEDAKCRYCERIHGGIEELYDLRKDPRELSNIAADNPELVQEFRNRLLSIRKELDAKRAKTRKKVISKRISKLKSQERL